MTVAPNPVLIHRSRLPFRYPRRSLLRWYGPAANTSASSASANFNITSRTLPRNASLNRSGPKRPSIWLKHCILFPIGVFLLGLTLPMSQILFWDTERIRLLYFPQQAGRRRGGQILILLSPMARRPRVFAPALPCYRARQSTTKTFRGDDDYKAYLDRWESATRVSRALSCFIPA